MIKKILFIISLCFFIVPEILWSPLSNIMYSVLKPAMSGSTQILRINFLTNFENINLLLIVIFIQILGLVSSIFLIFKLNSNRWFQFSLSLILLVFLIISIVIFTFVYTARNGIGF